MIVDNPKISLCPEHNMTSSKVHFLVMPNDIPKTVGNAFSVKVEGSWGYSPPRGDEEKGQIFICPKK